MAFPYQAIRPSCVRKAHRGRLTPKTVKNVIFQRTKALLLCRLAPLRVGIRRIFPFWVCIEEKRPFARNPEIRTKRKKVLDGYMYCSVVELRIQASQKKNILQSCCRRPLYIGAHFHEAAFGGVLVLRCKNREQTRPYRYEDERHKHDNLPGNNYPKCLGIIFTSVGQQSKRCSLFYLKGNCSGEYNPNKAFHPLHHSKGCERGKNTRSYDCFHE